MKFAAIALDLGTTSIKAGLLDRHGALSHIVAQSAPPITATGGCYESDALSYAAIADQVLDTCLAQADGFPPLGLCSQRSSFLIWESATGQPITPLISWQDNRGAASCDALRADEKLIRDLTGLPLAPYYFAPKLRTVLQDHPEWLARLESGELRVGTLDTFLIWRWTGGRHYLIDASMAARTLLMDTRQQQWSPQLQNIFCIPSGILPEIKSSADLNLQLDNGLMLQASMGDQSAALIASVSADRAEALANLGTGCFVVRYLPECEPVRFPSPQPSDGATSHSAIPSKNDGQAAGYPACGRGSERTLRVFQANGYLRTLVYQDSNRQTHFAIEGTLNSIAAALAPYPVSECRIEDFAQNEIFCIAEPSGLGAPYFCSDLKIRFSEPVEQLAQRQIAVLLLEAVIFRVARILEDFHRESALERVYLSGGLSGLACLQQGIAQCVPLEVYLLSEAESSLRGAAMLAAGMEPACCRDAERIEVSGSVRALPEKYRRWKEWLDALLTSSRMGGA